jgi:PIN domain nuclease of toxin-antitoxin system
MNILLDTCTFLWIITGSDDLSTTAREAFAEPANEIYLSAASCWEISVKWSLGRLPLPKSPAQFIPEQREKHLISPLAIAEEATFHLPKLPHHHRDPFDRILICQAIEHSLVLLTPDNLITQYPVRTLW